VSSHSLTNAPEQNHDAMRATAERSIAGPGPHEPIPGEYDATTLTHREAGAVGGAFNGADNRSSEPDTVPDDQTRREWMLEGGGRDGERLVEKHKRK
jgi:hypothetical protein